MPCRLHPPLVPLALGDGKGKCLFSVCHHANTKFIEVISVFKPLLIFVVSGIFQPINTKVVLPSGIIACFKSFNNYYSGVLVSKVGNNCLHMCLVII